MVTHIVLWNLKDKSQKAQQGGEMKRRLEALVGVVPGLLSAQAGPGFNGFDVGLVCTLESREALDAYQCHPRARGREGVCAQRDIRARML